MDDRTIKEKHESRGGGDIERRRTTTIRDNLRLIICCHRIVDRMAIEKDRKSMLLIKGKTSDDKRCELLDRI